MSQEDRLATPPSMVDVLFPSEEEAIIDAKKWLAERNCIEVGEDLFLGTSFIINLVLHLCPL